VEVIASKENASVFSSQFDRGPTMRLSRLRFTVRGIMIANLAVGIFLAWIVGWEDFRVRKAREAALAILAEDTNDPLSSYRSPQQAIAASRRFVEKAQMWAEGWPSSVEIVCGATLAYSVTGLALAISKAILVAVRRGRKPAAHAVSPAGRADEPGR
jgi:hypothetical protein